MQTVVMAIAIVTRNDQILLRNMDPAMNPYHEPWGLFSGRIEGDGTVLELLNVELQKRWGMTVRIVEPVGWDEDQKCDHDGKEKRFIYLDARCELVDGAEPKPVNPNERLTWAPLADLMQYELNPPTHGVLLNLGYLPA